MICVRLSTLSVSSKFLPPWLGSNTFAIHIQWNILIFTFVPIVFFTLIFLLQYRNVHPFDFSLSLSLSLPPSISILFFILLFEDEELFPGTFFITRTNFSVFPPSACTLSKSRFCLSISEIQFSRSKEKAFFCFVLLGHSLSRFRFSFCSSCFIYKKVSRARVPDTTV